MKVGGIAGQKADGSIQGLGIGDSTTMLKKFKKEKSWPGSPGEVQQV